VTTATRAAPVELLPAGAPRDQWLTARRGGIGASEIAAVLGISPWESPFSLYWRKVNGWTADINDEMTAGTRAEPVIADWFAEMCLIEGEDVLRLGGLYANAERPWQLATPDRLICKDRLCGNCDAGLPMACVCGEDLAALLECKYVVHGWDGWGEPGTDDIPVHYRAQALWQLDVMGVDEVYVAAWHGATFREYLVRRDETDLRMMREAGRRFMQRIADDEPPDVDEHTATLATLKKLHPSVEDRDIQVGVEFAEGYRRARDLARRATALVDRYDARARILLGNARRLVVGKKLVVSRSVYDQSGDSAELMALDDEWPTTDRLNPGRAKSYVD
jgi:putative phage-type endonuclease